MSFGVILCGLGGAVPLVVAIREAVVQARLRRHGVRAEGTVLRHVFVAPGDEVRAPVIEFFDHGGRRFEFTPSLRGAGLRPRVGSRVAVVYPDGDPGAARVFTRRFQVLSVSFPGLVGVVFLGAAVVIALQPTG